MLRRLTFSLALCLSLTITASAQQYESAQDVLQANIEATGGDGWKNIQAMNTNLEIIVESPQGLIMLQGTTSRIFPGYMFMDLKSEDMPMINQTMYMTPEGGWMVAQGSRTELADTSDAAQNLMRPFKEELTLLSDTDTILELLPSEEMEGTQVYVVRVGGEEGNKRFYDMESLYLLAVETASPMGAGTILQKIGGYQEVSGLMIPYEQEMDMSAMGMTQTIVISKLELNPSLTPADLQAMADASQN